MHGDILGRERDRAVHARTELRRALPRQPRDEVEVDIEPVSARQFISAVNVRGGVPPADARERRVAKALRIDADARHAELPQEIELALRKDVRSARLDGVFRTRGDKRRERFQDARELRLL